MDKKIKAMESMLKTHDYFIKEIDIQITDEKNSIRKHSHRAEILDYMRGRAETAMSEMVKIMNGSLN